jgi:hypothetical protein
MGHLVAPRRLAELMPPILVDDVRPPFDVGDLNEEAILGSLMSWDEAFARRYDEWSAHMTEDVAFYVDLALQADGPLVELGVGNGRVAISVAQATGRPVIGIDSSPAMLERGAVPRGPSGR